MKLITCDLLPFLSARDAGEKRAFRAASTAAARRFEGPLVARADTTCPVDSTGRIAINDVKPLFADVLAQTLNLPPVIIPFH